MTEYINAPFTPAQVKALNRYQNTPYCHPYTCARRGQSSHLGEECELVATVNGWICPFCDYRQEWASALLLEPEKLKAPRTRKSPAQHTKAIHRRLRHLEDRIGAERKAERVLSFDVSERDALRWVIETFLTGGESE